MSPTVAAVRPASVNEARRRLVAKRSDHPLHFAPAAEMNYVAKLAAAAGTAPRFGHGVLAEAGNQLRGLGKRAAAGNVDVVTQNTPRLCCNAVVDRNRLRNCCAAVVKMEYTKACRG